MSGTGSVTVTVTGPLTGPLNGRTAVITGGGTGFGAGIARGLAAAGARVLLADAMADRAEAVAQELGCDWTTLQADDAGSVAALAYRAADLFEDIDILVAAALPPLRSGPVVPLTDDGFDATLRLAARPFYLTTRAFAPAMQARRSGVILNLLRRLPDDDPWSAAAHGWGVAATLGLAAELGAQGLRVNALSVLADPAPALPRFLGGNGHGDRARQLAAIPLGRYGLPDDLGQAALFLCADAASLVTGQIIRIDGGAGL